MQMNAVIIDKVTRALDIRISKTEVPRPAQDQVLIRILSFGLNHSELILRLSEIDAPYIKKPVIPGIECVGIIEDPNGSAFAKGQLVTALMGGMGRNFDGSYAEFVAMPVHHVFSIRDNFLDTAHLGAVPETFFTAFGSLFDCLKLTKGDSLLIRGATCALGYASIKIAKAVGAQVAATTHKLSKLALIREADRILPDDGSLAEKLRDAGINKVLDLVGPKYLKDTLNTVAEGGIVCSSGILGGDTAVKDFYPITDIKNGTYLTGFYSNYPKQQDIDAIFDFIKEHKLTPPLGRTFSFENIQEALSAQETGSVDGKIVVTI